MSEGLGSSGQTKVEGGAVGPRPGPTASSPAWSFLPASLLYDDDLTNHRAAVRLAVKLLSRFSWSGSLTSGVVDVARALNLAGQGRSRRSVLRPNYPSRDSAGSKEAARSGSATRKIMKRKRRKGGEVYRGEVK